MGALTSYRLRLRRKRLRLRSHRKGRELSCVTDRTGAIAPEDVLLFGCLRNEAVRLPHFLEYYRRLGVAHFLIVDNGSTDGSGDWLSGQADVSLWHTDGSYRSARFGMDWINRLLSRHGHGHWCLTVDADELLVFPFCDTRTLPALTAWLDAAGHRSFGAMLLDLYPDGRVDEAHYAPGDDPVEVAPYFDAWNYTITRHHLLKNLFIQGGPRARTYFPETPEKAPALNKIPLVRWDRRFAYASSTHALLPRRLNVTYDDAGGESLSGCLLHTKFIAPFAGKVEEEMRRGEHFARSREYRAYHAAGPERAVFRTPWSERYTGWRQLDALGLMSRGGWA